MMGNSRPLIMFLNLLFLSWSTENNVGDENSSTPLPYTSPSVKESHRLSHAINEFGYKLMLNMMKNDVDKNVIISPTGIAGLLAMTLLGSVGTTYDELASALGFSQDILENRKNHEQFGKLLQELNNFLDVSENFKVSNSSTNTNTTEIFDGDNEQKSEELTTRTLYADAIVVDVKTRIRNIYQDYLDRVYRAEVLTVNFGDTATTLPQINNWIKNHTIGKIEDFLQEPLPLNTKVVLLSALYFSGQWARPFFEEYTTAMKFHKPSGDVTAKLMLNLGKFDYAYKAQHGVHVIAIPYNDSTTKMYVLKPVKVKKPLLQVLQDLDYQTIEQLTENMTEYECVLRFPKMDLKSKVELSKSLKDIGIKSLFTPSNANLALMVDVESKKDNDDELLTRIYKGDNEMAKNFKDAVNSLPNPGIHVDSVLHDVKMTINEYGTVAAAATSGFLSRTAKLFYVDSPFYMFIRNEKTKLVTFSGVIFDPTDSS